MKIRFHLDESVHSGVADGLRRRGIDVSTAQETELIAASDQMHLAFARGEGRTVVTHDADFLKLHAKGAAHSGIAFCHNQSRGVGDIIRALEAIWIAHEAEEMVGRVMYF